MWSICWCSGIAYSGAKRSNMGSVVQQWGWFADSQESRFQPAKRTEMCSAIPQWGWFVDTQESRIQVVKRSDIGIAVMKGLRFADTQELGFEAWKQLHMWYAALLCGRFAEAQKSRIQAGNIQNGCAVPPGFNLLMLRNRLFRFRTFKCGQCRHARIRFADSPESRFQASKCSMMCSAVLVSGWSAEIQEFCFHAAKRSDMNWAELQGCLFPDC